MKKLISIMTILVVMNLAGFAGAATIDFSGNILYHTDVVQFNFSLASDATNVRVWTDSFQNGVNFDPITALWTDTGNLIDENDDDDTINPATQTIFDSGFALPTLAAGNYIFTVAMFSNFANGTTLAEGFNFDGQTPQLLSELGIGGNYHVIFDGVDTADPVNPVPEPSTFLLLGAGLLGAGLLRRKIKS